MVSQKETDMFALTIPAGRMKAGFRGCRLAAAACGLAVLGAAAPSWAATPAPDAPAPAAEPLSNSAQWNQYERDAVKVVTDFIDAWDRNEVDKALSLVGKNFEFRGDVSAGFSRGRDNFNTTNMKPMFRDAAGTLPPGTPGSGSLGRMEIKKIYAIGDWYDTTVLVLRVDTSMVRGKKMVMPVAATYRVAKGKIQEWLDAPTIKWDIAPPNLTDCAGSPCDE
jgi:limonene-1,2-epoxide hydrolase